MIPDENNAQNPGGDLRTLGILWVLCGVIRLIAATWLVFFSATATLMFSALPSAYQIRLQQWTSFISSMVSS